MLIDRIRRARLAGRDGLWDVAIDKSVVSAVTPSTDDGPAPTEQTLDAAGRVVVAAFVDAHVHLDKAFLACDGVAPHLSAAIAAVDGMRATLTGSEVRRAAERAVDSIVAHGTVVARAHAEVGPSAGLVVAAGQLELAEAVAQRCTVQVVAFPQLGLEAPGAADLLGAAMALGTPVVGGCPYADADPAAHLDVVFGLAEKHSAPVDLHLDFTDDPSRSHLALVIERTTALGMLGQVVVGHVTTLAAMAPDAQARALDGLAAADIGLVVVPTTDLHLGGHGEPGTRSLAPVERARAAGVRVAVATNNIANPFAPYGNGSLLHAAWLTGITRRIADPRALLEAITTVPASLLGVPTHGPVPGAAAYFVVLDTTDTDRIVAQCPSVAATVNAGSVVYARTGVASGTFK